MITIRNFLIISIASALSLFADANATEQDELIQIGIITDMSGTYADLDGAGGVQMVRWAIEDTGGEIDGRKITLKAADHQNKADIASGVAREWLDDGYNLIIGGTNSAALLAISTLADAREVPFIATGSAVSELTNDSCNAFTIHYSPTDTTAAAKVTAKGLFDNGKRKIYYLGSDYTFGKSLVEDGEKYFEALGGDNSGAAYAPLGTTDWASFLLQAQSAKPDVLALANAGHDFQRSLLQAKEFGLMNTMDIAGFTVTANELDVLPMDTIKGLILVDGWYATKDKESLALAERFKEKFGRMPTSLQVADYSATKTYLEAIKNARTTEGKEIMKAIKSMELDDAFVKGYVRADGRLIHDVYQLEVIEGESDDEKYDLREYAVVKGKDAFITPDESKCDLLVKDN